MGNSPSKNDPLPNISSSGVSASATSASAEEDEKSSALSRPTGNGSDVYERFSNFSLQDPSPSVKRIQTKPDSKPHSLPQSIPKPSARKRVVPSSDDIDIDASMAMLLNHSGPDSDASPTKWRMSLPPYTAEYGSLVESLRSDEMSVSPVFTANYKDESLLLSDCSFTNLPTQIKPAGNPFQTPLESSLTPIVEASAESTPEPRTSSSLSPRAQPSISKTDYSKSVLRKMATKSSPSISPPLVPLAKKLDFDLDNVIDRLLAIGMKKASSAQSKRKNKDKLPLTTQEIKLILARARSIFMDQPTLLKLAPPVKIVGDIHGQFHDLIRIFNSCGYPPYTNYLFLGDYVDRGYKSLETILLLLCYKIKYPENFFMLRGNHESANITKIYGFYDECKRRLPIISGSHKLWKNFIDVFNTLPIAATINDKIFCIHGGLSPDLVNLKQIENILRPTDIPDKGLLADLLWSDPDPMVKTFSHTVWPKNDRGVSYCFGKKHVDHFLSSFNMDLIVRGHMVVEDGYEFFNKRKLVTIFLAPNYCGEFNNYGAIMSVDKGLCCSFELLKPQ